MSTTKHHITYRSKNKKVGPMSVTRTTTVTCPRSCPLFGAGCYDEQGKGGIHRRRVDAGKYTTFSPEEFLEEIGNLTRVYRHNEGGDLWNGQSSEHIDAQMLKRFVEANAHERRTPIVYTHKPVVGTRATKRIRQHNLNALREAKAKFALNVSVESLREVDEAFELGLDAVVVLPDDAKKVTKTPGGHKVVTCPATWGSAQCTDCGGRKPLCTRQNRGFAIGFPAHGARRKSVLKVIS